MEGGTACATTTSSSAHTRTLFACTLTATDLTAVRCLVLPPTAQRLGYVLLPSFSWMGPTSAISYGCSELHQAGAFRPFFTEDCRLCKASAPATFRQPSCPGVANPKQKHTQQPPRTAEFRDQKVGFLKQTLCCLI